MKIGQKQITVGAFVISGLIHLTVLLLIGGFVLIVAPPHREVPVASLDAAPPIDLPPEEPKPDPSADPMQSEPEPQANATSSLQVDAPDIMTSAAPATSYTMLAGTGPINSSMPALSNSSGSGNETSSGQKSGRTVLLNPFGMTQMIRGGLTGTFYDLKQDPQGKPTQMNPGKPYLEAVSSFSSRFDESILRKYYSCPNPLHAPQIFIPMMRAAVAPAAFQVENQVKPAMWLILYKGTFAAPQTGTYRLVGYADDVMIVNVDGRVVLDGCRRDTKIASNFKPYQYIGKHHLSNGEAVYGTWLHLNEGQNHDIQILVGERPGGGFAAFLLVQQKGVDYQNDTDGRPILPIFKLVNADDSSLQIKSNDPLISPSVAPNGPVFTPSGVKD